MVFSHYVGGCVGVLSVCRSGWVDPPDLQIVFLSSSAIFARTSSYCRKEVFRHLTVASRMAEHVLAPDHANQLVDYLRFLKRKREACIAEVAAEFKELRESRLFEDQYTREDVEALVNGLLAVVRTTMKKDLQGSGASSVLLLKQVFEQAEKSGVSLSTGAASAASAASASSSGDGSTRRRHASRHAAAGPAADPFHFGPTPRRPVSSARRAGVSSAHPRTTRTADLLSTEDLHLVEGVRAWEESVQSSGAAPQLRMQARTGVLAASARGPSAAALQDGQSGSLGEAIAGHHGLIRLHLKARGCPPHSGAEAQRLRPLREAVSFPPEAAQVDDFAASDHSGAAWNRRGDGAGAAAWSQSRCLGAATAGHCRRVRRQPKAWGRSADSGRGAQRLRSHRDAMPVSSEAWAQVDISVASLHRGRTLGCSTSSRRRSLQTWS